MDAWFVGYTPNLSTAVWVGADVGKKVPMYNITIGGQYYDKVCGGCLPGPIWKTAMTGALNASETPAFNPVSVPRAKEKEEDKEKGGGRGEGNGGGNDNGKPGTSDPIGGITLPPGIIGGNDGGGRGGNGP